MKFWRFLLILATLFATSYFIHLPVFGPSISISSAGDILFVVGIVMFLPAIAAMMQAQRVFMGIRYVFRLLFTRDGKTMYPTYSDYVIAKTTDKETTFFKELFVASAILLIIGIVLSTITYMNMV